MRGKKKKKTEVAINCQGGAVAFMFLSSPLPLRCAASPTFLTVSHELGLPLLGSGKWPPLVSRAERERAAAASEVLAV